MVLLSTHSVTHAYILAAKNREKKEESETDSTLRCFVCFCLIYCAPRRKGQWRRPDKRPSLSVAAAFALCFATHIDREREKERQKYGQVYAYKESEVHSCDSQVETQKPFRTDYRLS